MTCLREGGFRSRGRLPGWKTASRWHTKINIIATSIAFALTATLVGAFPAAAAQPDPTATLTVSVTATLAPPGFSPALKVSCPVGIGHYDRTHECWLDSLVFVFKAKNKPVGSTVVTLFQYLTLRGTSLVWSEQDVVVGVVSSGVTAPISGTLSVSCDGIPCFATADFAPAPVKIGSSGSVGYDDQLLNGETVENMTNTYVLAYEALPYIKQNDAVWSSPWPYRCDNGVAYARSVGCVVPTAVPTLTLKISQAGASAAMFRWAQHNMDAHWGLEGEGEPLTRANDTGDTNEAIVCDRNFKRQGTVIVKGGKNDVDSCDEFPYAATEQSGASQLRAHHETGAACVQLHSVRTANSGSEAAQWGNVKVLGKPNYGAVCVRGHVPDRLNNSTGGSYSIFIKNQQLYIGEDFWVAVAA